MLNTVDRFKRKISDLRIRSFSHKLLNYLNLYLDRKETIVSLGKNELNLNWRNCSLNIKFDKNEIMYEFVNLDEVITGKYVKCKAGFYTITTNKESTTFDLDTRVSHDVTTKTTFKFFDKRGFEQFRRTSTIADNYSQDKITGDIKHNEPNIMENYTEHCYQWRVENNYVLQRKVRTYLYPDGTKAFINIKNSDDCYVRYRKIEFLTKEIPDYGDYYGIDNEVFFKYFQGEASFDDIADNFRSKDYKIRRSIEF